MKFAEHADEKFPPREVDTALLVRDFLEEEPGADDRLSSFLTRLSRRTICNFLGTREMFTDDLAQEASLAVLAYIRRRGEFQGDLDRFTITVARNTCRNFVKWRKVHEGRPLDDFTPFLASHADGPLDWLLGKELFDLVQKALDQLDEKCRDLLRALFQDEVSIEEIRRKEGVKVVQTVYYRRAKCLEKVGRYLRRRMDDWD
ncbi:hypothetical protein COW53_01115 [bacterium CG17_big_fil_post_rev_8_21_14_2_50_64_8]|nr:MAG: hypothetical protein COW53_01115 [bacterium CG17_big_fil_post_rev_8_21_14_2_50_64_8]PJA74609.1 MAG: hypothetical protein CO151_09160 [bacterium CG_4_9_14_3_um_filter_65_15]